MRIVRLDDMTINQIAAGEVVENSASVLKELVENSLDAGSTHIQIELLGGGRQLVRVADNGCGMDRLDLLACLERHATSKLHQVADLDHLLSFGFRGEAIPSVASISRLRIASAVEGDQGAFVRVEGGICVEQGLCPRERGTTVEVRDLFYNVPARLKFQKTPAADLAACTRILRQMSLAHPSVRIELVHGSERVLDILSTDETIQGLQSRARQVLGADWNQAKGLDLEEGLLSLRLLLLPVHLHRPNRSDQLVLLNNRLVQCPSIGISVREALAHRLDQGRFPGFIAALRMPPHWVDVNVHPQKREVRLRHEAVLRGLVARATRCITEQMDSSTIQRPLLDPNILVSEPATPEVAPPSVWQSWQQRTWAQQARESAEHTELPVAQQEPWGMSWPQCQEAHVAMTQVETTAQKMLCWQTPFFQVGDYCLLEGTENGFWASSAPGFWIIDLAALKRAYLAGAISGALQIEPEPLLLPQELEMTEEAVQKLPPASSGFLWERVDGGIRLVATPSFLGVDEASALLSRLAEGATLDLSFWRRACAWRTGAVPVATLLAQQATWGSEMTALGESFRAWMSENNMATYLSSHGTEYSSFTSAAAATEPTR
jgi:DNA mismatch repair protein MutL